MEIIGGILILIIINVLYSCGAKTIRAAGRTVMGKGSLSENVDFAFNGFGEFQIRLIDTKLNDESKIQAKEIQCKGGFPLAQAKNINFMISIFDNIKGKYEPVISAIESLQEENSVVYQQVIEAGKVEPDQGFVSWVKIAGVIPEILEPPYSGTRELIVLLRIVDADNLPDIAHGFHQPDDPGILWQNSLKFTHNFVEKGYLEVAEHRDEAASIMIKIGMAVAMSDKKLDDSEGEVLKNWILKAIRPYTDEKQEKLKALYNEAMKESYLDAVNGDLCLSSLVRRLHEIGEKTVKYETIELCFEIMAADGVANAEEMTVIRNVADGLNLDLKEIEKMRDQKIIGLNASFANKTNVEALLGINPDWPETQIMKHLRSEFQKWNNRLNTLTDEEERDNAQKMLDLIAEARKKYA